MKRKCPKGKSKAVPRSKATPYSDVGFKKSRACKYLMQSEDIPSPEKKSTPTKA